jgi:3-deoxy-manno-octulosonate cytidylyltransferase (CMP-KDO synthetase)
VSATLRYGSTRFPAKPLASIGGKPMIWHTYTNACKAKNLDYCCVATDDPRIEKVVKAFGGEVGLRTSWNAVYP